MSNEINALEAHNGLSAKIVEQSKYNGIWVSSLTDSLSRGLPDNELVTLGERLNKVREIRNVSTKPIIVDCDTGGSIEHFPYWVKQYEKAGVYAMVIEDKMFPKQNSLLDVPQKLEEVDKFSEKIRAGKKVADKILIIARLESLIAKHSIEEALIRAEAYEKAGADAILIHSKKQVSATEVMEFAAKYRGKLPLVCVPTTYKLPKTHPFKIVIHANHLLRASYKAMNDFVDGKGKLASVDEILKCI